VRALGVPVAWPQFTYHLVAAASGAYRPLQRRRGGGRARRRPAGLGPGPWRAREWSRERLPEPTKTGFPGATRFAF